MSHTFQQVKEAQKSYYYVGVSDQGRITFKSENYLTQKKSDVTEAVQQTIPYLHLRFKSLSKEMVDFILKRKPPLKLPPCAC